MRSNGLLKWLMVPVALLVLFISIRLFSGGGSAPSQADRGSRLTPEEMKALGIEGDTPRDTVATLIGQVKQLRTELQTALSDNKSQREENLRLHQRENSIDQRINSALESERSNLRRDQQQASSERQQTEGLLADLQRRLDSMGSKGGNADLPVGLGLRKGDEAGMEGGLRWVEPGAQPLIERGELRLECHRPCLVHGHDAHVGCCGIWRRLCSGGQGGGL